MQMYVCVFCVCLANSGRENMIVKVGEGSNRRVRARFTEQGKFRMESSADDRLTMHKLKMQTHM